MILFTMSRQVCVAEKEGSVQLLVEVFPLEGSSCRQREVQMHRSLKHGSRENEGCLFVKFIFNHQN